MATSDVRAEQRTVIKFCYESGMTPLDTLKQVKQVERHRNVSRALLYKLVSGFREGKPAQEPMGRPQGPVQFYIMRYPPPPLLSVRQTRETMSLDPYQLSEALDSVSCDRF